MVRIVGSHPTDPGSNPGRGTNKQALHYAAIAQLGERQTEDLKVPGSIPGGGKFNFSLTPFFNKKLFDYKAHTKEIISDSLLLPLSAHARVHL